MGFDPNRPPLLVGKPCGGKQGDPNLANSGYTGGDYVGDAGSMVHNGFDMDASGPKSRPSGELGLQCQIAASASPVGGPGAPEASSPGDTESPACGTVDARRQMRGHPLAVVVVVDAAAVVETPLPRSNPIFLSAPCAGSQPANLFLCEFYPESVRLHPVRGGLQGILLLWPKSEEPHSRRPCQSVSYV